MSGSSHQTGIPGAPPIPAPTTQPTDWQTRFREAQSKNNSNRFVNYRYNLNSIQKSFAGCVGTDEDGRPQVQFDNLCDPNNTTNSNPCRIDDNYHTPDTCKLSVSMIDSKKRFNALRTERNMYEPGLRYTIYDGSMGGENSDGSFTSNNTVLSTGISTDFSSLDKAVVNTKSEMFIIEWIGYFKPGANGSYAIKFKSDDYSTLWIDDAANNPSFPNRVLYTNFSAGYQTYLFEVNDTKYHKICIRFQQYIGPTYFDLQILDNQNRNIVSTSLFHNASDSATYYSLIRNETRPDLYNCYMTNSENTVERSKGKKYKYRTLISFQYTVNGSVVSARPSMYAAVGDDGTLQIYDAAKSRRDIDFTGAQVRDGNHPDFVCRLNRVTGYDSIEYNLQSDGNLHGYKQNMSSTDFLSWQEWLGYGTVPSGQALYNKLMDPNSELVRGAFNLTAYDYNYSNSNTLKNRNIIVHKNNPYNKSGKHYHLIGDGGSYKFRMNDQGDLSLIYAVSACKTNYDDNMIYTETPQSVAFYNVTGDPKLNRSFYYDGSDNTLSYIDKAKYPELYSYNKNKSDYTKYNDIYIPKTIKDDTTTVINTVVDEKGCESACNSNAGCNFYYYESNPKKCYIDTGKYKPQFTPSSDPSGSHPDNIRANPAALYVKEQTVNVNPLLSSDVNVNDLETNYAKYNNAKMSFNGASFATKFPENTPRYGDPELAKLRTEEINWNYSDYPGGYDVNNVLGQNVPSGVSGFVGSGSGYKEGFGDGDSNGVSAGGDTSTLSTISLTASGSGTGGVASNASSVGMGASSGPPATAYVGPITQGSTVPVSSATDNNGTPVTDSVNNREFERYVAPAAIQIIQKSQSQNVAFYDTIKQMMENVVIHLPMYKLENNGLPCCFNKGFLKTNYARDGSCPDGLKIILTKNGSTNMAFLHGTSINFEQTDDRLPFSSGYFEFNNSQVLQIHDTINYPQQYLTFSFYFKLSQNVSYSKDEKPRIFEFSNGPDQDNIGVFFTNSGQGRMNLAFGCRGKNVYGENNKCNGDAPNMWYEDYFENVNDGKWHFCEWVLIKNDNFPNGNNNPNNPIKTGIQITWQLALHTLNNDGSVSYQFQTIYDSTFSNYKDWRDSLRHPEQLKYIQNNGPWDGGYMSHQYAYIAIARKAPREPINGNSYYSYVTGQTRDYVCGYDNIRCIQNIDSGGIWYAGGVSFFATVKTRLSFPTVPTTQNFIGNGAYPECIFSSKGPCGIRDFKMIINEPKQITESPGPGSFSFCVFNKSDEVNRNHSRDFVLSRQLWKYQPIVTDINSGVFSNSRLPYKFMSPALNGSIDPSRLTTYNPDITNNLANFIYSQIIYRDNAQDMLKPYLVNMSKYGQNDSFQNIEGFTSFREGATFDESIREPEHNQYYPALMYNADTQFGRDKRTYLRQLKQASTNTAALQPYLVNNEARYNELNNAKDNYYDFSGNELLYYNKKDQPSILDTRISDYQEYIIQQNSVYIIGTITCASLILAAVILGRQ